MPLATLSAQVTSTGISAPTYAEILQSLTESFQLIYGSDAYLAPDSQDGQLIAVFAIAVNDCNNTAIDVYNSFSPTFAQGVGLSSVVKINGIRRLTQSFSTVDVQIIGVAGTVIPDGIIQDANSNQWALPASVTIPDSGTITETATAVEAGAIAAPANSVNVIVTAILGWQTVNNSAPSTPGAPVETDARLRQRQTVSTSISAITPLASIYSVVANLDGVIALQAYENDTDTTDANGIPSHSISLVVEGGDVVAIAQAIDDTKSPGTGTYGTTTEIVFDSNGVPNTIRFFRPTIVRVDVTINITRLTGYTTAIGNNLKAAIAASISNLAIGQEDYLTLLFSAGYAIANSNTFNITSILQARHGDSQSAQDLPMLFNERANCVIGDIVLSVT